MRRRYLIDKGFQGRFIFSYVAISVVGMIISIGLFNYFALSAIENLKWRMAIYESTLSEVISPYLFIVIVFAVLLSGSTAVVLSKITTWKIAGPIYRLKKDIDELADGNLNIKFALRKKDAFKDIATELNAVASSLRERFKEIDSSFQEVKGIVQSIPEAKEDLLPLKAERLSLALERLEESIKNKQKTTP